MYPLFLTYAHYINSSLQITYTAWPGNEWKRVIYQSVYKDLSGRQLSLIVPRTGLLWEIWLKCWRRCMLENFPMAWIPWVRLFPHAYTRYERSGSKRFGNHLSCLHAQCRLLWSVIVSDQQRFWSGMIRHQSFCVMDNSTSWMHDWYIWVTPVTLSLVS